MNSHLKTWCCIDQGLSKIKSYFEKQNYFPMEEARLMVEMDNTNCKLNIKKLDVELHSKIVLTSSGGHSKHFDNVINKLHVPGVCAGSSAVGVNCKSIVMPLVNNVD